MSKDVFRYVERRPSDLGKSNLEKKFPDKYLPPPLPSALSRAITAAIHNKPEELEAYKRTIMQQIVNRGGGFVVTPERERVLDTVGISKEEVELINKRALEIMRKINPSNLDLTEVSRDFEQLLGSLNLPLPADKGIAVFGLGCGDAPEATACLNHFGERLESFAGYDKNPIAIQKAYEYNPPDPRLKFRIRDLADDMPFAYTPNLVIIRNPNVFLYEESGQNTPNTEWQKVFEKLKQTYPHIPVLLTTLTRKEAELVTGYLGIPATEIKENGFATHLKGNFGKYGVFDLPAAVDRYVLVDQKYNTF